MPRCARWRRWPRRRFATGDYAGSLRALAVLRTPVDAFFDAVMVNADDAALRANRLALLGRAARGDEPRRRPVAAGRLTAADRAMKLVILDRDGTINEDRDDYVKSADEWVPMPGRARGDRAAQPCRLAHGGRDQPVGPGAAACSTWPR